jgi:PKD repeat protein
VTVSANAAGSTDPQGQTLTYAFDFGDGTTTGAQAGSSAGHTYTAAGTYTVKVTVTDTSGLSASTTKTVTVNPAPAYVAQAGAGSATTASRTGTVTLSKAVAAGEMLVVTAQATTSTNKAVTATDTAGNTYALGDSQSDSTGARTSVLYGLVTHPLASGAKITLTFPTNTAYRAVADELTGVSTLDRTAEASGKTATFSSGATSSTRAARELVLGVAGLMAGTRAPTWATGWTDVPAMVTGTSYLGRAWWASTAIGTFTATGTATGTWAALALAFRP